MKRQPLLALSANTENTRTLLSPSPVAMASGLAVREVPGRGRGTFAARGFDRGEELMHAVPAAISVCDELVRAHPPLHHHTNSHCPTHPQPCPLCPYLCMLSLASAGSDRRRSPTAACALRKQEVASLASTAGW